MTTMTIGILGTGRMALRLATLFADQGHAVTLGSRVSDDEDAKQQFFTLVDGSPFRYVDAGRLANARIVERMTLFSGELGQRYGYFPRMNWRLLGEPWTRGQADRLGPLAASVDAGVKEVA